MQSDLILNKGKAFPNGICFCPFPTGSCQGTKPRIPDCVQVRSPYFQRPRHLDKDPACRTSCRKKGLNLHLTHLKMPGFQGTHTVPYTGLQVRKGDRFCPAKLVCSTQEFLGLI